MKARLRFVVPVILSLVMYSQTSWSQEQTLTGFYYPTGRGDFLVTTGWLAMNCNGNDDYVTENGVEKYHTGSDIRASSGNPVYAISNGEVIHRSEEGWGEGNVALIIKHELSNSIEFLAIYGHIRSNLVNGSTVSAGEQFATIGPFSGGDHLHFGIQLDTTPGIDAAAGKEWGKMFCSNWPDTNGFIEPITWIEIQTPPGALDPLDQQAIRDMENRAASDSRFLSVIAGTFGKDLDWYPNWELRQMDFNFSGGRIVTMYHATSKSDSSIRYTIFWDPDTNSWNGWEQAF